MTNQEWKKRCAERILKAVRKAGKIKIRDLQRATHYNRGPAEVGIDLWDESLYDLEARNLVVIVKKKQWDIEGDDDNELGFRIESVMTPQAEW
ncbi:MAG: hypothetical protein WCF54_13380 [Terracidiphilus sp.]